MADIIMPKMGDAMEEGRIVQWLKNVGDPVAVGDVIAEIETDKSNVEIESEAEGTLQSIAVQAGDAAPVGSVIAVVGAGSAAAADRPTPAAEPPAPATSNGASPAPVAETPAPATPAPAEPVRPAAAPVQARPSAPAAPFKPYDSFIGAFPANLGGTASVIGAPLTGDVPSNERVRATPVARAMAAGNNLDLAAVQGTGPDGQIVKKDVEAALAGGGARPAPAAAPSAAATPVAPAAPAAKPAEGDEVQEYGAMRRTIAQRLAQSKATIPHFYVTSEIDVEAMLALRAQVLVSVGEGGPKITLNDFLVKAVAVAIQAVPVVNSVFSDNKRILRKAVHIGVAVSIEDGLIVPVIKDCQAKSIRTISAEARPLIQKAREMKLKPDEYTGGTFTISNLGQYDVENFAAIINPGEGAILAISSIREVPAVVDGQIVPRRRMKVTLCADHRVMDGVDGARFLQELKRVIESPMNILI